MKKSLFVVGAAMLGTVLMSSCGQQPAVDPSAVNAKVDSIAAAKIEQANTEATANCEARMATEVSAKADSIVGAAKNAATGMAQ